MRKICAVIQRKGSMQGRRLTENQPPLSSSLQKRYRKPLEISIKWFRCGSSCISFALLQRSCCSIHRLSSSITQRGHYAAGEYGLIYLLSSFTWELSALSNDDRNDMEKFLSWQTPKSIATVQHDEFILAIFFRFFFFFFGVCLFYSPDPVLDLQTTATTTTSSSSSERRIHTPALVSVVLR